VLEKKTESEGGAAEATPDYHGHRARLRARFREAGAEACLTTSFSNYCCFA